VRWETVLALREVLTEMAKVKEKFMIMVTGMLKLNPQMEEERPRSRVGGSLLGSQLPKNYVHIVSPTSRSGTGARSVWQDVLKTGLTFSEVRRNPSRFRRCAWIIAFSGKRPGRSTSWCWSARTGRRS
jgi:hypothetical protein